MTDQRILDAIKVAFIYHYKLDTLEQLYELVQAQIPGRLTESDRRQIREGLELYCKKGLVKKVDQGGYLTDFDSYNRPDQHDRPDPDHRTVQRSVRYLASARRGQSFSSHDVLKLNYFYDIQDKHIIKRFIDSLCQTGQLKLYDHPIAPTAYQIPTVERPWGLDYNATASFKTDRCPLDEVDLLFARDEGRPITLEQIYESVQAQMPGKLAESDRRQIKDILRSHRQNGLIAKTRRGRYRAVPDVNRWRKRLRTMDHVCSLDLKQSVAYIIFERQGESFTSRDVYSLWRFYDDAIRNRHVIERFIDELHVAGLLESVGPRRYRATAKFVNGVCYETPFLKPNSVMVEGFFKLRRKLNCCMATTDRRLLDAVNTLITRNGKPITLAQIYESVQAQMPGRLTESDRRQIRRILHSHRQQGVIRRTGPDAYKINFGFHMGRPYAYYGMEDLSNSLDLEESVTYFISDRQGQTFTLRDLYGLKRFYKDAVRNTYKINKLIDELHESGLLELAGPRTYRATASFGAEPEREGSNANAAMVRHFLESRRELEPEVTP